MDTPRSQTKVAMNYGAMYGLSGIAVYLLFYFIGTDVQSRMPQFIGYILLIIFIVMGVKSYRDNELGGYISYGKSLGTGVLISIFGGIITGAFTLLFFQFIAPDMLDKIMAASEQRMIEQGMSEDQIEMGLEYARKFMSPVWLFLFSILGSAFMGLIFSLIISIFMKKEQNPFNTNV